MTPDFKVIAAGINITPQIRDRLLSLTIMDEAGLKSDSVEITLDDRDGLIELPIPGAPLIAAETRILALGFRAGVNGFWSIKTARHTLDSSGFTTSISAERPGAE